MFETLMLKTDSFVGADIDISEGELTNKLNY